MVQQGWQGQAKNFVQPADLVGTSIAFEGYFGIDFQVFATAIAVALAFVVASLRIGCSRIDCSGCPSIAAVADSHLDHPSSYLAADILLAFRSHLVHHCTSGFDSSCLAFTAVAS